MSEIPEMKRWWLSFSDPTKAKGSQWLGVAIVDAVSAQEAWRRSHALDLNPGGEVEIIETLEPKERSGRFYPAEEAHRIWGDELVHSDDLVREMLGQLYEKWRRKHFPDEKVR